MKKLFQVIGIFTLLLGSFMYTDSVTTTSKLSDDLLNEIKEKSSSYRILPKEAIINNNTIITGVNGKEVDIKKSYEEMKKVGYFNDKLLVYKTIVLDNLKNNTDKYIISGNKDIKWVSLVFKAHDNDDIREIVNIFDEQKVRCTFFITSGFLEKNNNLVIDLLQKGYTIGNLSDNENYNDSDFVWMKTVLINTKFQKYNYCYAEKQNKDILNICNIQKSYTIIPSVSYNNPFVFVKNSLSEGKIMSLKINSETKKDILNIINYVKAKGYEMVSLEKMINGDI